MSQYYLADVNETQKPKDDGWLLWPSKCLCDCWVYSLTAINLSLQANKLTSKRKAHDDAEKAKKKARK